MAIASLCCSIAGLILFGIPAVLGVIFGFVARSQINNSRGSQRGMGLAIAGIVVGLVVIVGYIAIIIFAVNHPNCRGNHPTGC
jgi:predicted acyltransferase